MESETEIIALLKDMQRRLNYLEKKIDALSRPSGAQSYSPAARIAHKEGGAFAKFKNKRSGRQAGSKRGIPGGTYPKKNQSYKPKKK